MILANNMMGVLSLRPLDDLLQSRPDFINDGELDSLVFQLLRQGDPSMSLAWHSIWHGLERTP